MRSDGIQSNSCARTPSSRAARANRRSIVTSSRSARWLTAVSGGSASVSLGYDGFGRLYQSAVGGASTYFSYMGDRLTLESSYGGGGYFAMRDYVYDGGQPYLWHEGGYTVIDNRYLHADRLGSVVATTNSSGAVTAYAYGPYGEPQTWAGSRFRYTGQLAIPEAQLYHYRARAYDPMLGRFLQTDPIGYGDGPNIYAYVHGDPVNGTDPSGLGGPGGAGCNYTDCNGNSDEITVTGSRCSAGWVCIGSRYSSSVEFMNSPEQNPWGMGDAPCPQYFEPQGCAGPAAPPQPPPSQACDAAHQNLSNIGKEIEHFGDAIQWGSLGLGVLGLATSEGGGEVLIGPAVWGARAGGAFSALGAGVQGYAAGGPVPAFTNATTTLLTDFLTSKLTSAAFAGTLGKDALEQLQNAMGKLSGALADFKKTCS